MFRNLSIGLIFLFLVPGADCYGRSLGHMQAVSVSPSGKLIAVVYELEHTSFIYKIDVQTGVATRLTDAKAGWESSPTFSADGKQIAYSYSPGHGDRSRIMVGNVDGTHFQVWSDSGGNDFRPLFSPDGKTIILARSRFYGSYSPIAQPHPHDWSFYAANLDGTNVRQLSSEHFYMASEASVSPDGKRMVVVTESLDSPKQIAIYSLDHPERPEQTLRPHVPKEADHNDPIYNCPNYMPDGKSMLFMAASNGKHGYDYDVYRLDIESGALEKLTDGNGYATNLKVFADGKTAVFLKWRSDWHKTPVESSLYVLDLQSHKVTPFSVSGLF